MAETREERIHARRQWLAEKDREWLRQLAEVSFNESFCGEYGIAERILPVVGIVLCLLLYVGPSVNLKPDFTRTNPVRRPAIQRSPQNQDTKDLASGGITPPLGKTSMKITTSSPRMGWTMRGQ